MIDHDLCEMYYHQGYIIATKHLSDVMCEIKEKSELFGLAGNEVLNMVYDIFIEKRDELLISRIKESEQWRESKHKSKPKTKFVETNDGTYNYKFAPSLKEE